MPRDSFPRFEPSASHLERQKGLLRAWRDFSAWVKARPIQASGIMGLPNILLFSSSIFIGLGAHFLQLGTILALPPLGLSLLLAGCMLSFWAARCRIQFGYGGKAGRVVADASSQGTVTAQSFSNKAAHYFGKKIWDFKNHSMDHTLLCNIISAGLYAAAGLVIGGLTHPFVAMGGIIALASLLIMSGQLAPQNSLYQKASQMIGSCMFIGSASLMVLDGLQTAQMAAGIMGVAEGFTRTAAGICAAGAGVMIMLTKFDRQGAHSRGKAAQSAPDPS